MNQRRVSALIPARNEAANIARVVRSLAAQPEVAEIIVADDRSEDGTGAIATGLIKEVRNLRVIQVDDPPPGWLGKTHALVAAASEATGEWLLFTDADTVHLPGSLGQVLERAEREGAALLSLSPGQDTETWWERAIIPYVFVELARRFSFDKVNDPASRQAAANGQYLLIRREAYDEVGGHEAIHQAILEDVALAARVKQMRRKILFLPGAAWVRTRMYRDFDSMWDGWRKNLYLLFGRSWIASLNIVSRAWLLDVVPALSVVAAVVLMLLGRGLPAIALGILCVVAAAIRRARYGRELVRIGFARDLANYGPIGAALFSALLVDSTAAHRWRGSVTWKGRTYSTRAGKPPGTP